MIAEHTLTDSNRPLNKFVRGRHLGFNFFIRNSKWKSICVWLLINFPIDRPSVQRDQQAPVTSQECSIGIPGHIPLQCGEQLSALSTGSGEQRVEGHVIRYIRVSVYYMNLLIKECTIFILIISTAVHSTNIENTSLLLQVHCSHWAIDY